MNEMIERIGVVEPRSHEDTKVLEPELRFSDFSGEWLKSKTPIKIVAGNAYPMSFYGESGSMLVQGQNIFPNELKVEFPVFIPEPELSERDVQIKQNDILLGLNRPIIGKRLKACLYRDNRKAVLYQRAGKLVFDESKLYSDFLFQYLFSGVFTKQLLGELVGSDQPYIKSDLFKVTKNYFPDIQEQQKIADFLSSVDKKIEQLTEKHRLLTEYKKGVMQQIFTQQIRFKDNNGNDYPEWRNLKLSDVAKFSKGKGISKSEIVEGGKTPCIRYGELYTHYNETIEMPISSTNIDQVQLVLSEANDVIIPASGETNIDIATASCVVNKGIALSGDLNIIRGNFNGVYLAYYLNSFKRFDIAKLAQGNSVVHLYNSQLSALKIEFPCDNEQQKIADFLAAIDQKIQQTQTTLNQTQAFKKGLLQKMFV